MDENLRSAVRKLLPLEKGHFVRSSLFSSQELENFFWLSYLHATDILILSSGQAGL